MTEEQRVKITFSFDATTSNGYELLKKIANAVKEIEGQKVIATYAAITV